MKRYLFDKNHEHSSCGVGFITHKQSVQSHELLAHAHQALCMIPHRGGMSAEGIGDGAGVNIDLSLDFFRKITANADLQAGEYGVANFFYPVDEAQHDVAEKIIKDVFNQFKLTIITWRDLPVAPQELNAASQQAQLAIKQVIFTKPSAVKTQTEFEQLIHQALLAIEYPAYTKAELYGLYPLSMSSRTQVLKGRLNSWEVVPYFKDLMDEDHKIHTLFFHTRFSTNTAPNPMFAQPFHRMAHNGELNTDRKNRLSEDAIARINKKQLIFPQGQSDSARLDQTLARRICEDKLEIDVAALAMMPPAWENDQSLSQPIRNMLEYFSLYEEKNDGPAAFIFGDGVKVGARLDRLGLRPLRSVETNDYLAVMSEAGQIDFPPEEVIRRGRIEAGGMIVFDHQTKTISHTQDVMSRLAAEKDYQALLTDARINLTDLPKATLADVDYPSELSIAARHVAYSLNQESFKFMLDPMLQSGMEKISAMGYGLAPNALAKDEGGVSRYFSQRFAQVTNPPLDSIREADGMTLRVALGPKPNMAPEALAAKQGKQLVLESPIIQPQQLVQIYQQTQLSVATVATLFEPDFNDAATNQANLLTKLDEIAEQVEKLAREHCDIVVLSDQGISRQFAAVPAMLAIAAANQRLIQQGLRFNTSLVFQTGQASSTHDIATLLGFGASAICPLSVCYRAQELYGTNEGVEKGLNQFQKAVEKALMKTMGKFGLCTAESYIGGEFFEANFIDTHDAELKKLFPNIHSPVGGARFADIAQSAAHWHEKIFDIQDANQIPVLGLFKERSEGAGHSFGNTAVREYINMTEEVISYTDDSEIDTSEEIFAVPEDDGYKDLGFEARTPAQIDAFKITPAYRQFCYSMYSERDKRPAALRDVLALPLNFISCTSQVDFTEQFSKVSLAGSPHFAAQGIELTLLPGSLSNERYSLALTDATSERHHALFAAISALYAEQVTLIEVTEQALVIDFSQQALEWINKLVAAPLAIDLAQVQPAHEITASIASGAMSHGALVAKAHEAVAHGTNIAGALSNSGEGGEKSSRYNTVKASKIKQFASGRFGVWTGYLADPCLEEIEIKIAQGAKPGEGGQLPSAKVTVEIAAARGGTPGVELVSPPPHHDTYSIEDLGQLIHDAKAARVRVIVKLVSSEGIGTIAVGVAKAGADVINVAGGTGGTGAAQVTSLKNTGRAAGIGIVEVHQALSENGLRDKVVLRCSNAHQTGLDVIKSAIFGGDSFEFGTTALMMLKCVMAKNCNVKCPAGLTTNAELYQGDPRALAQYFINLAHEVRELLASLGYRSLRDIRGRTELLYLVDHPAMVGQLDMSAMLRSVTQVTVDEPVYLEASFTADDNFIAHVKADYIDTNLAQLTIEGPVLNNCNKTTGGQFSIDIERLLNHELSAAQVAAHPAINVLANGRKILADGSLTINTYNSAGQSYAAFNNSGIKFYHTGTCNDGVGKGASGGSIIVKNPGGGADAEITGNVLIGNFALFGATGCELFVEGQAGDRFGVRNSGAVAVVEGVGDFCCEYMTNGSIVNLGVYGKGFGNGMSGGSAYQYDPSGDIVNRCSQDSVKAISLAENNSLTQGQEIALHYHLTQHVQATNSVKAASLLADWDNVKQDFYVLIPLSLFNYQCSDVILAKSARKTMLEELAQAYATKQLLTLKTAYADLAQDQYLFTGKLPDYGERDSQLICQYINATGTIRRAFEAAEKSDFVKQGETVDRITRYMFESEDRKLVETLAKDCKSVLASYNDQGLACLLANKRLQDYKDSLNRREVWDSRAWGTSVWIIERDRENLAELAQYPSFEQQLAAHYCHVLAIAIKNAA